MKTAFFCIWCVLAFRPCAAAPQPSDSQQIILTSLNNGDTLRVGETVSIEWVCIDAIVSLDISLSPDFGKTWILLNGSTIMQGDMSWGHYKWVVPEKIKINSPDTTFELAGNSRCLFRVESPTDKRKNSISAKPVTILTASGIIVTRLQPAAFGMNAPLLRGPLSAESRGAVRFFDARGRTIVAHTVTASGLLIGVLSGKSIVSGAWVAAPSTVP